MQNSDAIAGKTVRLFLVDGTPTGIITAEIMNWTGHVLSAPRNSLPRVLLREEASRTGIYLLIGEDPDQPSKLKLYVGEGDNVKSRISQHAKDEAKDFFETVVVVTSKDLNLTKSHVRYLESRIIELARLSARANLSNGTEPMAKGLPESDVADMEFFLNQISLVLPVIGVDVLRLKPDTNKISNPKNIQLDSKNISENETKGGLDLEILSDKNRIKASAIELNDETVVLKGSYATTRTDFASNTYESLKNQLIADGKITKDLSQDTYIFQEDVVFKSPSAAAAVILGRNSNGRIEWKLKSNGMTLKEWQNKQLENLNIDEE
jgi:hypothetical protein